MIQGDDLWIRRLSAILQREETVFRFLYLLRYGSGMTCPRCGGDRMSERWSRRKLVCLGCRHEVSPLAGTLLHRSHLSLVTWVEAVWLITRSQEPVTALGLMEELKLGSYRTAWLLLCKIRKAMEPENNRRMAGVIEMNDRVYRGQGGSYEKTVLLGSLLVAHRGLFRSSEPVKPFLKLAVLTDPDEMRMKGYLLDHISRSSRILTDEKKLYLLNWLGLNHYRVLERGEEHPPENINRILDSTVSALRQIYVGVPDAHLPLYLNEMVFRFNHREEEDRGFLKLLSLLLESREYPLSFFRKTAGRSRFLLQLIDAVLRRDEKRPPETFRRP